MSPQDFQLRPVRVTDLPTLKRWRSLPEVQSHLRHPSTSWADHLKWFLRIQRDPTCRVWAVVYGDQLVGQAGLYYKMGPAAEVSLVVFAGEKEAFTAERVALRELEYAALRWGVTTLWAEVLSTAPLQRHTVFPPASMIWADTYSTIYRWSLA